MPRKQNRDLKRQPAKIDTYKSVLIVCEGEKTEPLYFESLKKVEGLTSADIKVVYGKHSTPIDVIKKAIYEQEKQKQYLPFDKVYCVIDGDVSENLNETKELAKENNIQLIISYPCIEYWYICHFKFYRSFIGKTGKSAGYNCESILNTYWKKAFKKDYTKNQANLYALLRDKLETAIKNAKTGLKQAQDDNELNPSTQVYELVDYLRNIKTTKQ
ncbi:TPA: RloB family protein [Mannheimia haemolytica]